MNSLAYRVVSAACMYLLLGIASAQTKTPVAVDLQGTPARLAPPSGMCAIDFERLMADEANASMRRSVAVLRQSFSIYVMAYECDVARKMMQPSSQIEAIQPNRWTMIMAPMRQGKLLKLRPGESESETLKAVERGMRDSGLAAQKFAKKMNDENVNLSSQNSPQILEVTPRAIYATLVGDFERRDLDVRYRFATVTASIFVKGVLVNLNIYETFDARAKPPTDRLLAQAKEAVQLVHDLNR